MSQAARQQNFAVVGSQKEASGTDGLDMKYLIRALVKYNASDLHIKVGRPPLYRVNGRLIPAKMDKLEVAHVEKVLHEILTPRQREELQEKRYIDLSFRMGNFGRFRCSVFFQKGFLSAVVRSIPLSAPTFEQLGLPPVVKEFCKRSRGLILVTGPTGSGKSMSLAAMVQYINETRHQHILTLEDPIEFMFRDQKSAITQREVGVDTRSFRDGLYEALRQDPDVIVIGEMRDPEIIRTALTAAETGHLVISTMHTKDARGTVERVLDSFPADMQQQIRLELASVLVGVVSQVLLPRPDGEGRLAAFEVMAKSPQVEDLIVKGELEQLSSAIAASNHYYKMQTFNQSLEAMVRNGQVGLEEALRVSPNPADLQLRIDGIRHDGAFEMVVMHGQRDGSSDES